MLTANPTQWPPSPTPRPDISTQLKDWACAWLLSISCKPSPMEITCRAPSHCLGYDMTQPVWWSVSPSPGFMLGNHHHRDDGSKSSRATVCQPTIPLSIENQKGYSHQLGLPVATKPRTSVFIKNVTMELPCSSHIKNYVVTNQHIR